MSDSRPTQQLAADVTRIVNIVTSRIDHERRITDPEGMRAEIEAILAARITDLEATLRADGHGQPGFHMKDCLGCHVLAGGRRDRT